MKRLLKTLFPPIARDQSSPGALYVSEALTRLTFPLNNSGVFSASAAMVDRSEEHTSELQSLMRISYAVFCLKKKTIFSSFSFFFLFFFISFFFFLFFYLFFFFFFFSFFF